MKTTTSMLGLLLGLIASSGCEVTNPGPVQDEFLDQPTAHQALVNGAGARLTQALGYTAIHSAYAAREVFPTGQCCGGPSHSPLQQAGRFVPEANPGSSGQPWGLGQQARWIAEDAARRFDRVGNVSPTIKAQAYLWAGYANRLLGENMCEAVFDGGAAEPNIRYFERAQTEFTNAIAAAPAGNIKTAAYAGRASVRVWLKDWAGATSDAQQVALGFTYTVATHASDFSTFNYLYYGNSNQPYRTWSQIHTWFETYYPSTGDPRVRWDRDPAYPFGSGSLAGYTGAVSWLVNKKYTSLSDPYRLSTGREMVLIRAEALLVQGDRAGAMTLINSLRTSVTSTTTGQPLVPWTASTLDEAWTALKRERAIELFFEARRLGDIRRWAENKTPGSLDWPNYEARSSLFRDNPPSQCMPIPDSERDANPNLPPR